MQDNFLYTYPKLISEAKQNHHNILMDIEKRNLNKSEEFGIMINGIQYAEREDAGNMLMTYFTLVNKGDELKVGQLYGFDISLKKSFYGDSINAILQGNSHYTVELGNSAHGNIIRLENTLANIEALAIKLTAEIENHQRNLEESKIEFEKPFLHENELNQKLSRQSELNALLDMTKDVKDEIFDDENSLGCNEDLEYDQDDEIEVD